MSAPGWTPSRSVESLVVDALPEADRQLLRRGAVLRYITRELAGVVTDSAQAAQRLVSHPVLQGGGRGRSEELWTIPEPMRRALLTGWDAADDIRARVADASVDLEALYVRLAASETRYAALRDLERSFERAMDDVDVPQAHDLLRLLDEWPVIDAVEARRLRDRLAPRLRRYSRALRDREATESYLERDFDQQAWEMLRAGDERWLLHLHGPGGRGKTMFVKNLLGRTCPQQDIPVARIDFDHITRLAVATTQPWRLLLSIAAQLDPQLPNSPFGFMLASYGTFQALPQPEALPRVRPTEAGDPSWVADEMVFAAARDVPRKFRTELAVAAGDRLVVVALDTVENVLHTEGADIEPLLAELGLVVHGVDGEGNARVPGLRVVVSGRFDLGGERRRPGGRTQPRARGFSERWVGPQDEVERRVLGSTEVRLGREVATLEVPGFSPAEARRFLTEKCALTAPPVIEAIVERAHDNPMKLALLAEYVRRDPDLCRDPEATAARILSLADVDLFYLVDRVVDRIPDGRVQWMLRWGALLPILTRASIEHVIWPALDAFAEADSGYDDASKDPLPESRHDVSRWAIPPLEAVRRPGAQQEAWEKLLDYAARSSWVSAVPELPDAVVFHPEVREPLRRLLRRGGHRAYDDIHRRSLAYWSGAIESTEGAAKIAAMRSVLFHAYQSWRGADHDGDRLFRELLERRAVDRAERQGLAEEVLELADHRLDDETGGPSADVRALAHLEVAEALVDTASRQFVPVSEGALSLHLDGLTQELRAREPRRVEFLRAVLAESSGRAEEGWATLERALDHPPPRHDPTREHVGLMTTWAASRTPPRSAVDVARRLVDEAGDTGCAPQAAVALSRGLLAAELWTDALDAARRAGSADLEGAALIGLGRADDVVERTSFPGVWRARARLLRYEPRWALLELGADPAVPGSGMQQSPPAELLVRGQASARLDRYEEGLDALSRAASSPDAAISVEAGLESARLLARIGRTEAAASHLQRLLTSFDPLVTLRSKLLETRLFLGADVALNRERLADAERCAHRTYWLPPSVEVDLAVTRLAVLGVAAEGLRDLRDALASVSGAAPRLLALGGLADVPGPAVPPPRPAGRALRQLTALEDVRLPPAALVLARAELERVLGDGDAAASLLQQLTARRIDQDGALIRAVQEARARLIPAPAGPGPGAPDPTRRLRRRAAGRKPLPGEDERRPIVLRIRTDRPSGGIRVERPGIEPDAETVRNLSFAPLDTPAQGSYALASAAERVLDELGHALLSEQVASELRRPPSRPLHVHLGDEESARWPWEIARVGPDELTSYPGVTGLIRRHRPTQSRAEEEPVTSPAVLVTILDEGRDRGHVADLLASLYGERTELVFERSVQGGAGFLTSAPPAVAVVHVVADPVERRRVPALRRGDGGHLTPESLARDLGNRPRLLVLDLVLSSSDYDAAEQLMIANAFCWHLVRNAPDVSVLCGVFGGANDRLGGLRQLTQHLVAGDTLATTVGDLQRNRPMLPGGRHPLRDFVSLSTGTPDRRFHVGRPA